MIWVMRSAVTDSGVEKRPSKVAVPVRLQHDPWVTDTKLPPTAAQSLNYLCSTMKQLIVALGAPHSTVGGGAAAAPHPPPHHTETRTFGAAACQPAPCALAVSWHRHVP